LGKFISRNRDFKARPLYKSLSVYKAEILQLKEKDQVRILLLIYKWPGDMDHRIELLLWSFLVDELKDLNGTLGQLCLSNGRSENHLYQILAQSYILERVINRLPNLSHPSIVAVRYLIWQIRRYCNESGI